MATTLVANRQDPEFRALPSTWQRLLADIPHWRSEVGAYLAEILVDRGLAAPDGIERSPANSSLAVRPVDVRLGRSIRFRRCRRRLSLRELSSATGIHNTALSRIERGRQSARIDQLAVIASGLDCSISDLIEGADPIGLTCCGRQRVEHLRVCPVADELLVERLRHGLGARAP
jgi:transcriptional regulator with XRE-family HTH domain